MLDVIVLLDQLGHVTGGARRGNVFQRLRGLRIEADARDVLGKYRDERKPKSLVKIGDELVARHLFQRAIIAGAIFIRQMPVHVVGIPPSVVQALPKQPSLADAANFMPPRDDSLLAVLPHELAQRVDDVRFYVVEHLIVHAKRSISVGRRFVDGEFHCRMRTHSTSLECL